MNKFLVIFTLLLSCFYSSAQKRELQKLYNNGKFDLVIQKCVSSAALKDGDPEVNLIVGRSYADKKKFEEAIPYLESVNSNESINKEMKTWVLVYLGKCYFTIDKMAKANEAIKNALLIKGSRAATKLAQRNAVLFQTSDFYKDWKMKKSMHFRFHFQNLNSTTNWEEYIAKQEVLYQRLNSFFEDEPTKKIDIYIWADKYEAYREMKRSLSFSNADLCIINVDSCGNTNNELCQLFVNRIIHPKKKSMLINNGLSVYFNQRDKNLFYFARKSIPKNRFYVQELWEEPTRYERNLSNPVGGALIDFLINKGGKTKLKEFLKDQTIEHAKEIYPDFNQWMKTFEAMLMR